MANYKLVLGGCSVKKSTLGFQVRNVQNDTYYFEGSSTYSGGDGTSSTDSGSLSGEFYYGAKYSTYGCRCCKNKYIFQCDGCDSFICYDGKEGKVTCPICKKDCNVPATKTDRIVRAQQPAKAELEIIIAMDVSASMKGGRLEETQKAANDNLIKAFPDASFAIVTFESSVQTVQKFTKNQRTLLKCINNLTAGGGTRSPLPHICNNFKDFIAGKNSKANRYLVILTDGAWTESEDSQIKRAEQLKDSGVVIITIGCDEADTKFLAKLASPGASIEVGSGSIGEGFATAAKRMSQS